MFQINMIRSYRKSSVLNSFVTTDINLKSTAQLNLNFTESLVEVYNHPLLASNITFLLLQLAERTFDHPAVIECLIVPCITLNVKFHNPKWLIAEKWDHLKSECRIFILKKT